MRPIVRTVSTPAFTTEIREHGEGPTLVLIQGGGTGKNAWNALVDRLAPRVRCVAFDNRGVGGASHADESLTIEDLARDAASVIEALGEGAVHVAGVSLGGFIAMRLAAMRPDLVSSLTLHATAAKLDERTIQQGDFRRRIMDLGLPDTGGMIREYLRAWAAGSRGLLADLPADVVSHSEFSRQNYLGHLNAIRGHDMGAHELGRITAPTLITAGAEDILCSLENARFLHRSIPGSQLVILERAGHVYYFEEPVLTGAVQEGWIMQHVDASASA
ncbi:alpha/beta fold hydrolase [Microbacterium immunditiarum]|uniref:Pimeloyl-ACP methyl ester carboxylesterase n=1 Tax=Microbacterium immunditiarum TaxID=337480 RepID=A0A7Y9GLQ2_9MICO|nr:alpha/beta fold hydrolase [Microbacterium immunditiarum]NYE18797.1 pimeloyl-ACP methyl ester carboxylesterase [Microbacterium immunditiarum]